jgi:hypothetical protein
MTSCSSMTETMGISREHFGHRSGSASHTFLINSRHFLEGMRRDWWAETSIRAIRTSNSPAQCSRDIEFFALAHFTYAMSPFLRSGQNNIGTKAYGDAKIELVSNQLNEPWWFMKKYIR